MDQVILESHIYCQNTLYCRHISKILFLLLFHTCTVLFLLFHWFGGNWGKWGSCREFSDFRLKTGHTKCLLNEKEMK